MGCDNGGTASVSAGSEVLCLASHIASTLAEAELWATAPAGSISTQNPGVNTCVLTKSPSI